MARSSSCLGVRLETRAATRSRLPVSFRSRSTFLLKRTVAFVSCIRANVAAVIIPDFPRISRNSMSLTMGTYQDENNSKRPAPAEVLRHEAPNKGTEDLFEV